MIGKITWSIHQDNPATYTLESLQGWSLINPLVYSAMDFSVSGRRENIRTHVGALVGKQAIIDTSMLMFTPPDELNLDTTQVEAFAESLTDLIMRLRSVSQQVELSRVSSMASMSRGELPEIPAPEFPCRQDNAGGFIRKYIVDTAVTWEDFKEADAVLHNHSRKIFDTLLLDAILALIDRDYRRALLYSAMSLESFAATKLDETYEAALNGKTDTSRLRIVSLRIVSFSQPGGVSVRKDPVYESLARRTEFLPLLHERPLYLLGKSLLIDYEPLYQDAAKLYRTRNKIVHRGEPPLEEAASHFEITEKDARAAIECVISVLRWFGESTEYTLPTQEFVPYEVPEST